MPETRTQKVILAIDDDPDVLDVIRLVLEKNGYCMVAAETAEDAEIAGEGDSPLALTPEMMSDEEDDGEESRAGGAVSFVSAPESPADDGHAAAAPAAAEGTAAVPGPRSPGRGLSRSRAGVATGAGRRGVEGRREALAPIREGWGSRESSAGGCW